MLSSNVEPDHLGSLTLQMPSGSSKFIVHPTTKGKKITSFSSWMEAWNVYLAIRVDHTPSYAPSLIAYQRIITSASVLYPLHLVYNHPTDGLAHFAVLQLTSPTNVLFVPTLQGSYLVDSGMMLEDNPQDQAKTILSTKISQVTQHTHTAGSSTFHRVDVTTVNLPMFANTVVPITLPEAALGQDPRGPLTRPQPWSPI